jgi:trehalose 6-phosphate synthase
VSRLVAVSNRVALPTGRAASRGGLAVGLLSALEESGGLWFGWNGKKAKASELEVSTVVENGVTYATMPLSHKEHRDYYLGFSNRMLWPLFHYRLNLLHFSKRQLEAYLEVNDRFARELVRLLRSDDLIWVHDYHLIPLGDLLRERGVDQRIGFFLHTPFPPLDVLRALPQAKGFVRRLLAYDVVGFQTDIEVRGFLESVEHFFPEAVGEKRELLRFEGRHIVVDSFPIGVDVDEIQRMVEAGKGRKHSRRLEESLTGTRLILGVDRLDYSKGLAERVRAYARLLENWPEYRHKIVFLQIAPPSRSDVPEYEQIRHDLSALAGELMSRYADYDWLPLRYLNRGFPRASIMSFLARADIGFLTPLRDGMNLVAKEFVAAQDPDDPGMLVLSSMTGAARELTDAIIVNPYDIDAIAAGLARALAMPREERRVRWRRMIERLRAYDIHRWSHDFMDRLGARPT